MTTQRHALTSTAPGPPPTRLLRGLLAGFAGLVLIAHGLVHLMGTALQWQIAELGELRYADAVPLPGSPAGITAGAVWLAAAVLFLIAGSLLSSGRSTWRRWAFAGVVASVAVIAPHPGPAVAGLVVDGVVILLVVGTSMAARRTSR